MKDTRTKRQVKEGLIAGLPLIIGYFPIAMAFGLLSKNTGISFRDTSLFSIMVYAGASQFMALNLILANVSAGSIILATFLLNLRHMIMSASLSLRLDDIKPKWLAIISFGLTDESFSVLSFSEGKIELPFILALHVSTYWSWVFGTMAGHLVGEILPKSVQASLGIGLYAMFIALLVPEMKKLKEVFYLAIISVLIYLIIFYLKVFNSGWDIILGIIISSALGVFLFDKDEREVE